MKELNGRELVGYIKEGQARRVRQLKAKHITPKLAILYDSDNPVIAKYMRSAKNNIAFISNDTLSRIYKRFRESCNNYLRIQQISPLENVWLVYHLW